ncbi:MAG: Uma2 family endonuclease [Planctomycetaceae bacterium]
MATDTTTRAVWTAADLFDRFGPIPLDRIRHDPPPGLATVEDVIRIHDRENRLCELIDGVLVEKTRGAWESYLALEMAFFLKDFVRANNSGVVLGADGMLQLFPRQVRIPDLSFISWDRWPGVEEFRAEAAPQVVVDLAVEVISKSNTRREMEGKLREYFAAGVRLVWYVDPVPKQVRVFNSPDEWTVLTENDILSGGDVLPGFELPLRELFREPQAPRDEA